MDRLAGAYAWVSLIKSGVVIAGGSDAPVERGEPMIEFYAAVARKDQKGFSGEGWHPEEAVSREDALKMFTLWPAYAAEEKLRGSIEVGKLADLTILSADIMTIPAPEILKTLRDDGDQRRDCLRRKLMRTKTLIIAVLCLALASTLFAQDPANPTPPAVGPVVALSLIVTDKDGKGVATIRKDQVRIYEDG